MVVIHFPVVLCAAGEPSTTRGTEDKRGDQERSIGRPGAVTLRRAISVEHSPRADARPILAMPLPSNLQPTVILSRAKDLCNLANTTNPRCVQVMREIDGLGHLASVGWAGDFSGVAVLLCRRRLFLYFRSKDKGRSDLQRGAGGVGLDLQISTQLA